MSYWPQVRDQFNSMVNNVLDKPELQKLFNIRLTPEKLAIFKIQMRHAEGFTKGRRDGWAAVASRAPLDVKRAIWEHEKEEMIFDERIGKPHLSDEDLLSKEPNVLFPGVRTALYAWLYMFREKPWLEGLASLHITERLNNSEIVRGGGFSERWGRKIQSELGESNVDSGTRVHMSADIEHSDMFEPLFEKYIVSDESAKAVIQAALDSLMIYRTFRGAIAAGLTDDRI